MARNRMPPTRDTITLDADARVADVPDPPLPLTGVRLEIWTQMWDQPIATLWNRVDLAALCRLVILQTTIEAYAKADLLREMRQLEDRFLLNPYSRAQQRVVIADPGDAKAGGGDVTWLNDARRRLDRPS